MATSTLTLADVASDVTRPTDPPPQTTSRVPVVPLNGFGVGDAVGCGVGDAVGCGVGDAVGCGVGDAVGCGVGVLTGVALGVGAGVDVGLGVAVGVAVAAPDVLADGAVSDQIEMSSTRWSAICPCANRNCTCVVPAGTGVKYELSCSGCAPCAVPGTTVGVIQVEPSVLNWICPTPAKRSIAPAGAGVAKCTTAFPGQVGMQ